MPMMEIVKGEKEKPLVLMTHPSGNPANVPARLVGEYLKRGFRKGYKEPKEVTERRAANKIDLVAENRELKEQLAKLTAIRQNQEESGQKRGRPLLK